MTTLQKLQIHLVFLQRISAKRKNFKDLGNYFKQLRDPNRRGGPFTPFTILFPKKVNGQPKLPNSIRKRKKLLNKIIVKLKNKIRSARRPGVSAEFRAELSTFADQLSVRRRAVRDLVARFRNNLLAKVSVPKFSVDGAGGQEEKDVKKYIHYIRDLIKATNIIGPIRVIAFGWRKVGNRTIYKMLKDVGYNVSPNVNQWWNRNHHHNDWRAGSGLSLLNHKDKVIIVRPTTVYEVPFLRQQSFRQKSKKYEYCVIDPIIEKFNDKLDQLHEQINNAEIDPKSYDRLWNHYFNSKMTAEKYRRDYPNGIPENKMQEFANDIKSTIQIKTILNDVYNIYKYPTAKDRFNFKNTRFDHLDIVTTDNNKNEYDQEALHQLTTQLNADKEPYIFTKFNDTINWVRHGNTEYTYVSEYRKLVEEFEDELFNKTLKDDFKINYKTERKLSDYLKDSCHIAGFINFKTIEEYDCSSKNIREIDMETAYKNFKINEYYMGFPTRFTDMRKMPDVKMEKKIELVRKNVGCYTITNMSFNNCTADTKYYFEKLKIQDSVYISPFVLFLYDQKVQFDITEGAWGISTFNFEFPEAFCKKENKIRHYSKYAGRQGSINENSTIYIKCYDKKTAELIKNTYPDREVFYHENLNELQINISNDYVNHRTHLLAYLAGYAQIHVMSQLLKIKPKNVIKIVSDGIYYLHDSKNEFELLPKMRHPEESKEIYFSNDTQYLSMTNLRTPITEPFIENHKITLLNAPGGHGKTHWALSQKGWLNKKFTAIPWLLTITKRDEYNIKADVFINLITPGKEDKKASFYIVDEIQMVMNDLWIPFLEKHPDSKIIVCGDYNKKFEPYQTCSTKNSVDVSKFYIIDDFPTNYRYNDVLSDNELQELSDNLRFLFDEGRTKQELTAYLINYIEQYNKDQIIDDKKLKQLFKNDYVLVSRSRCSICKKFECKHLFKKSGNTSQKYNSFLRKKNAKNRYMFTKKQLMDNDHVYNGTMIYSKTKPQNSRLSYAITIHKMTGNTVDKDKVFIDTSNIYDRTLCYSAISRARSINQIYLIL
jgi:hypothetical protein